jgi:hypothetical protein
MKKLAVALAAFALASPAFAQNPPDATGVAFASIEASVEDDVKKALAALDADDFAGATLLLRTASANANRLSLRAVTQKIAGVAPSFKPEDTNFVLAESSTIAFEDFLSRRDTAERRFKDDRGRVVTVRVFGEARDLSDFMFIKDDKAMLDKGGLEVAEMAGEPAIKRRGDGGELSVLMMSGDDNALIEIEGDNEDAVMAFIGDIEKNDKK